MGKLRYLSLVVFLVVASVAAHAQEGKKVLLEGGRIVPVVGEVIDKGNILIVDGRIEAVGVDVKVPMDAKVIDVSGKTIFPGMIDAWSNRGMDVRNENLDVAPYVEVYDSIDPSDRYFEEALRVGITSIHASQGEACVISGLSRVIHPIGMSVAEMTQKPAGGLVVSMFPKRGFDHSVQHAILRDTFRDLERYLDRRAEELYEAEQKKKGDEKKVSPKTARKEGRKLITPEKLDKKYRNLVALRDGKIDAFIYCGRAMDVLKGLKFVADRDIANSSTMIVGGECHKAAKHLKKLKRPVIIRPRDMIYRDIDRMTLDEKDTFVPKVLADAKVPFAIGNSTRPWYDAARCVRNGVSRDAAIEAITIHAAKAIGMQHLIGSIEKGKLANLLVLTGDPLDSLTWVESVLIMGETVYERSKDKRLREIMDGVYDTEKRAKKAKEAAMKKPETKSKKGSSKPGSKSSAPKKKAGAEKSK